MVGPLLVSIVSYSCPSIVVAFSVIVKPMDRFTAIARTRTHSLRLERGCEREVRTAAAATESPGAGELRKTLSLKQDRDKAHIITLGNSKFETVPFGLSQDIPDVFL